MPLTMRPTGLGHGVYKDNVDYGVFCGEWCIGRIVYTRPAPEGGVSFGPGGAMPTTPPDRNAERLLGSRVDSRVRSREVGSCPMAQQDVGGSGHDDSRGLSSTLSPPARSKGCHGQQTRTASRHP